MKVHRLITQIKRDEGYSRRVYKDSLGYKTVGYGHLITDEDPDWLTSKKEGEKITEAQVDELFVVDLMEAVNDAATIFATEWDSLPSKAKEVFVNMAFNLGRTRLLGFKKMIKAVHDKDWKEAAAQMLDSRWAVQVGKRATRMSREIGQL